MRKIINFQKGFTLIELLVVIAVIGILSASILAGIDPLEQIKKGQDTAKRNMSTEYQNGLLRYYSIQNAWPCTAQTSATLTSASACTTALINSGELKSNFTSVAGTTNLDKIFVSIDTTLNVSAVCFLPESKSYKKDPTTVFNQDGSTGCNPATSACYICSSSK
jgi:prepilin-type N-terminal cleavage/methylation domain-containing protein